MKKIKNLEVYEGMLIVVDMVNGFINCGAMHDKGIGKIIGEQVRILNNIEDAYENCSSVSVLFLKIAPLITLLILS